MIGDNRLADRRYVAVKPCKDVTGPPRSLGPNLYLLMSKAITAKVRCINSDEGDMVAIGSLGPWTIAVISFDRSA